MRVPIAIPASHRDLFGRVLDAPAMLALFQRELPPLASVPIRVVSCSAKVARSRTSVAEKRLNLSYRLGIEVDGQPSRQFVLLGQSPVAPDTVDPELQALCQELKGHPAASPFETLFTYVPELELAASFFPADPALPSLAEVTGSEGARLLAAFVPECREGATIDRIDCDLKHYKPFNRVVLRATASFMGGSPRPRSFYVKIFADERGEANHRDLSALWSASQGATCLRVPEPLGYDAHRRLLAMSEAPGKPDLTEWIKCIEHDRPLPAGVDLARLQAAMPVAAETIRELQECGIQPDRRRTYQDELHQLDKDRDLLQGEVDKRHPELVSRALRLLERLEALAPSSRDTQRLVPSHGGFRHKQTVGNERCLTIIDWDGLCVADPALDAATFTCRLRQEPVRNPGAGLVMEQVADQFRREFLERRPHVSPRQLALYEGLVLTERALRSFRRPGHGDVMARQIHHVTAAAEARLDAVEGR